MVKIYNEIRKTIIMVTLFTSILKEINEKKNCLVGTRTRHHQNRTATHYHRAREALSTYEIAQAI